MSAAADPGTEQSRTAGARNGARTRRFWIDPRFAIGVALIAASVLGMCLLLASQNHSTRVYVARTALVAGDRVRATDLELADVRVPASNRYLTASDLPSDAVVVRSVPKGELVPASAIGHRADVALTSVVVKASGPLPASVSPGARADVWAAHSADDKDYAPPMVLASDAIVVAVAHEEALVADRGSVSVEVRVPAERVASMLQAAADGQTLSVVPSSVAREPSKVRAPEGRR